MVVLLLPTWLLKQLPNTTSILKSLHNWSCFLFCLLSSHYFKTEGVQYDTPQAIYSTKPKKNRKDSGPLASWSSGSQTFHHRGPHDINFCDLRETNHNRKKKNLFFPTATRHESIDFSESKHLNQPCAFPMQTTSTDPRAWPIGGTLEAWKKSWLETCSASFYHQFGFSGLDSICFYRSILSSTDPWVTLTGPKFKSFYSRVQQCYPAESTKLPLKWTKCLDADPNNHILYHQSNSNLTNHLWIWSLQNICPPCCPQAIPGHYIHKMWTYKPCLYIETKHEVWKFALDIPKSNQHSHYSTIWITDYQNTLKPSKLIGLTWVPQQWKKHS